MNAANFTASSTCPCCKGRGTIAVDFSKPIPVPTVAKLAGIEPVLLHGVTTRLDAGLVDVEPPRGKGRFGWVTGPSALKFIVDEAYLQVALHPTVSK